MKDRINDGGAAFPGAHWAYPKDGPSEGVPLACSGMTLRDWFAGQALAGLCANSIAGGHHRPERRATEAWQQADAMLSTREGGEA